MSDRYETPRWDDEPPELGAKPRETGGDDEPSPGEERQAHDSAAAHDDVLGDPWERAARETRTAEEADEARLDSEDVDRSSENVLSAWPTTEGTDDAEGTGGPVTPTPPDDRPSVTGGWEPSPSPGIEEPSMDAGPVSDDAARGPADERADEDAASVGDVAPPELGSTTAEHAPGDLVVPPGIPLLEGVPRGERRAVGIVVSRFNGNVTTKLLDGAVAELLERGVASESVTVMPVPGAFELPLAAMALAKTRRFSCIIALGCVIRGDTPHFDYVASEAASGVQLAAIETGVPVAFGVLTLDHANQAEARLDKGAEAVRTALEMADLFANLRAAAAR